MPFDLNNGIAKALAILSVVAMMGSPAYASDSVSLPQTVVEPVEVRLSATSSDKADPFGQLQVFVGSADACCEGRIPMAGRYTLTDATLSFSPAFGFEPGQVYVARVWNRENEHTHYTFRLPFEAAAAPVTVTEIYPSGETLPENLLRFYIHFSVPMAPGVAFDYIKLHDASSNDDDAAFMRFKQELWDKDRTRLTVLIDPGRIKRRVATNRTLGTALRAGQYHTLSVQGGWKSADGTSVLPPFSKTFLVSDPLRTRPDAALWRSNSPCKGTNEPLEINFDRPFDRHLLTSKLRVIDNSGHRIEGDIEVRDSEKTWRFIPNQLWSGTELQLAADIALEDVAGNNFVDLLDHLSTKQPAVATSTALSIALKNCSG